MIGREYEIERLTESLKPNDSELIAVYDRRRIEWYQKKNRLNSEN